MEYLLPIYGNEKTWADPAPVDAVHGTMLTERGAYVDGAELAPSGTATAARAGDTDWAHIADLYARLGDTAAARAAYEAATALAGTGSERAWLTAPVAVLET